MLLLLQEITVGFSIFTQRSSYPLKTANPSKILIEKPQMIKFPRSLTPHINGSNSPCKYLPKFELQTNLIRTSENGKSNKKKGNVLAEGF